MRDRLREKQLLFPDGGVQSFRAIPMAEMMLLALLLSAELWIFSGSFHKFFTHDSLFYMTHIAHSWEQFRPFLLAPSEEMSYRPLNLAVVAVLSPFLGNNPHPWHWVPIFFHLANTLLFYLLARRILTNSTAVLAATGFWGLHSVAGWITYDITYLSDFLLAFLLLLSIVLAVEGSLRKSRLLAAASLIVFTLSLLTKEAAVTFPLAIWISLALAHLRTSEETATLKHALNAFKKAVPLMSFFILITIAFAALFGYWLITGRTYAQGAQSAYHINLLSNLVAKTKYLYWALNFPDALSIPNAARNRALALGGMGCLLLLWGLDVLRRRGRLAVIEGAGLLWFAGLNVPALLLSHRLAKWYLYLPLFGLALAFGVLAGNLRSFAPARLQRIAGLFIPVFLVAPILFSSRVQTMSYVAKSDSVYQSDLLQACLADFQEAHPSLPPRATLFFLPAFEEGVSDLLSVAPISRGELFQMYYPHTQIQAMFAHKGDRLPQNIGARSDMIVLQYLDRHLYDVTGFFTSTGKMVLYLLPTYEGQVAPLLKKEPAGGRMLQQEYVRMMFGDEGARLPEDYPARRDIWILQYMAGRFTDVTDYYKGRHTDRSRRVIKGLEDIRSSVDRAEYYPNYEHFGTPTGAPVFFPTPEKEILTQIGGSEAIIPLHGIPGGSRLRFDVSWMFEQGDGGWAEAALRLAGKETVLYREHMQPDPRRRSLLWKEVRIDLRRFEDQEADLVLKCYNDRGKNTVADWLNWRDIVIESIGNPGQNP